MPGVTPGKWIHRWEDRMPGVALVAEPVTQPRQLRALRAGEADMAFVRFPVDRDGLHVIPLYFEQPVVVAPKDHPVAAFDEVAVADLADEYLLQDDVPEWNAIADPARAPLPAMRTVADALDLVEAGIGLLILPMSVARHFNRKALAHTPVTGVAETRIGLAWLRPADPSADTDPLFEEFIGIVRGRGANSSRQPSVHAQQTEQAQRAAAKKSRDTGGRTTAPRTGGAHGKGGAGRGTRGAGTGGTKSGGSKSGGKGRSGKRGRR